VTNRPVVHRGDLYWVDWSPARGSEQAGRRPALVVQEDAASANPNYPLTIVAAVSTRGRDVPSHVSLRPSATNGLIETSFVKCEQIQTVSKDRLLEFMGTLDSEDLGRVEVALRRVLALD
jgi:mRNA interferase MazF